MMGRAARVLLCGAAVACLAAGCGLDLSGLGATASDGGATDATQGTGGGADGAPTGDDASSPDAPWVDATSPDATGIDGPAETGSVVEASTDSPVDVVSEAAATCTFCPALTCCRNGTCTPVGTQTCGDPGQECFDCTNASAGNQCIGLLGHEVCGCFGPGSPDQCPPLHSCHSQHCDTACDGQHPCNGGCCSGNDLATSTCVAGCPTHLSCTGNYCQ